VVEQSPGYARDPGSIIIEVMTNETSFKIKTVPSNDLGIASRCFAQSTTKYGSKVIKCFFEIEEKQEYINYSI